MRHRDRAAQAVGATSTSAVRTPAPTSSPLWTEIRVRRLHGGYTPAVHAEGRPPECSPQTTGSYRLRAGGIVAFFCSGRLTGTIGRWTPIRVAETARRAVLPRLPTRPAQLASQVMLAEYAALRAEVDRRANVQWNVLALQLTSAGVIASLAISHVSDIALLLVIPLSSYILGSRYILHDFQMKLISRYIRDSLSVRLRGSLAWESWKASQIPPDLHWRWRTVTGWNLLHPTRLAFEGIAWLALLTAALATAYAWRDTAPSWGLILGFALLWVLGALATYSLHRSFNHSSAA